MNNIVCIFCKHPVGECVCGPGSPGAIAFWDLMQLLPEDTQHYLLELSEEDRQSLSDAIDRNEL